MLDGAATDVWDALFEPFAFHAIDSPGDVHTPYSRLSCHGHSDAAQFFPSSKRDPLFYDPVEFFKVQTERTMCDRFSMGVSISGYMERLYWDCSDVETKRTHQY